MLTRLQNFAEETSLKNLRKSLKFWFIVLLASLLEADEQCLSTLVGGKKSLTANTGVFLMRRVELQLFENF